jgi:hypothetical protein
MEGQGSRLVLEEAQILGQAQALAQGLAQILAQVLGQIQELLWIHLPLVSPTCLLHDKGS